jgi:peroxiredoxin
VLDAAWTGDEVLTVEGHAVVRHDVSGNSPERVSVERRPATTDMAASWLRAIATNDGDALVVADDAGAMPLQLRTPAAAPDVVVDVPSVAMWADPGSSTEAIYLVSNEGTAPLHLRGVATASPFSASVDAEGLEASSQCPGQHVLEPGATAVLELGFTPDDPAAVEDTLVIETDDPDEPAIEIALDGNRPAPAIGEPAPDFSLLSLDGHRVRLSDHRERVVFLKLFNFGCSTCAMEFPEIEAQLLPDYDPADLAVIGINISHRTAYADTLRTDANLTLPIALDLQSEVFRHLRAPHKVFPLHVVIDRTGTIAHLDTNPGLTSIRAALEQLGTGSYP